MAHPVIRPSGEPHPERCFDHWVINAVHRVHLTAGEKAHRQAGSRIAGEAARTGGIGQ
jgi:hypothetical protein